MPGKGAISVLSRTQVEHHPNVIQSRQLSHFVPQFAKDAEAS